MADELILVVDDGQENREFVVDYVLKPNGYRAATAKDGRECLDFIARQKPDLILLDYQMPRMNGIEVLKVMIEQGINIPVILMTFYGSEEIAIEVYRLGVRDYIRKPFTIDEMLIAIERSLNDVRLRKEKEALTERLIQANRELQFRLQELNVLYSIGKSVSALIELQQLLPRIVDAAVKLTEAEEGFLYLIQREKLICQAIKRHNSPRAEWANAEVNDRVAQRVVESKQPIIVTPEGARGTKPLYATAAAPLVIRDQVIGVLGVRNVSAGAEPFTRHDSALLSALTDYAAIAIENSRNYDALRQRKDNEQARIRTMFQRFVPPGVVDQVLENPSNVQLGGKRQEVSVLFADLRGYSSYAESMPPEKVIETLNDYLSLAANVILSYGGTLDKYMGDGIMALFNAPDSQASHVMHAAQAALMLKEAAHELSTQRGDGLSFSIGIYVGDAVVGYVGTDSALNYTAIGDTVNIAKRLQETAKPEQILVEEGIVKRLNSAVQATPLGSLTFRNRSAPVQVYELIALTVPE
ncbi:MAG: adenylate/guanylate cyclase domain-containing protein [bacterium]|nr:adenylate/guanylate cyclase domain-containing protein [bacterium]